MLRAFNVKVKNLAFDTSQIEFARLRTTTISYQETSYHSAEEIVPHIDHIVKFVLMSYE